jgi:iron complex outermembrane recepter protein
VDFYVKKLFDENAQFGRNVQCPERICGNYSGNPPPINPVPPQYANGQVYSVAGQPRTFGIKFSQQF